MLQIVLILGHLNLLSLLFQHHITIWICWNGAKEMKIRIFNFIFHSRHRILKANENVEQFFFFGYIHLANTQWMNKMLFIGVFIVAECKNVQVAHILYVYIHKVFRITTLLLFAILSSVVCALGGKKAHETVCSVIVGSVALSQIPKRLFFLFFSSSASASSSSILSPFIVVIMIIIIIIRSECMESLNLMMCSGWFEFSCDAGCIAFSRRKFSFSFRSEKCNEKRVHQKEFVFWILFFSSFIFFSL